MINLLELRYVRLGTADLAHCEAYARRILGLELVKRERDAVYLRGDSRDHTLCYFKGDPRDHASGWEVVDADAMEAAAAQLEGKGIAVRRGTQEECERRRVDAFVTFRDPSGNVMDLLVRPRASGVRYFPSRDCGVWSFSHIGLRTTDPRRDEAFWTRTLNARVSDRIGDAPLLRIDEVHHRVALFPSSHPGVQHVNHQVRDIDDVMRSYYFLLTQGVRIVFGPGRHPTSGAVFLYFEGPDGMVYEYSTGVRLIEAAQEASHRPRQFPFEPSSFCLWGSNPDIPEFRSFHAAEGAGPLRASPKPEPALRVSS